MLKRHIGYAYLYLIAELMLLKFTLKFLNDWFYLYFSTRLQISGYS